MIRVFCAKFLNLKSNVCIVIKSIVPLANWYSGLSTDLSSW